MWTFFISLVLLVVGYLIYSRVSEKVFAIDERKTPAISSPDGVDKMPMSKTKAFLVELLNIAGTGPIFGAISGALFGPIAFIWIVAGCILGGAVHDYFSGMISSRHDGASIAILSGKYIGKFAKGFMTISSLILLALVTAVFVVSPSTLLSDLTNGAMPAWAWLIIILFYYLLATILPIDKIIGKLYPIFGIILIVMALLSIGGVLFHQDKYPLIELIGNLRDFSLQNGSLPWWPFMLTTIACGAVSGFHATQTPMIAKCIKSEKEGRQVFYGAMVAEGVIALIWCAVAMAFFKVNTPEGWQELDAIGGNSSSVYKICSTLLGPVGSVFAIVGVIICPITSGDTALRGARLILGEALNFDQKKIRNRLILTTPMFILVVLICIWNLLNPGNFDLLWRWFACSNQVLAALSLWVSTFYLFKESKYKFGYLFTFIPALIMSMVVITYIFGEPRISLGRWIPMNVSYIIGGAITFALMVSFLVYTFIYKKKHEKNLEIE